MPGLCGLLNHSCERRWRRVPLPAGTCPLVGFFVIGFSCNANALAPVTGVGLGLSACATPNGASDGLPARWRVVSSQVRYYSWLLGNATILFAGPVPERAGLLSERRSDELWRSITL